MEKTIKHPQKQSVCVLVIGFFTHKEELTKNGRSGQMRVVGRGGRGLGVGCEVMGG